MRDVTVRGAGKQLGQDRPGLADPPSRLIPAPDRANEPQAQIRLAAGDRPVDRGAEVPVVAIEAPHGRLPARPEHPLRRPSRRPRRRRPRNAPRRARARRCPSSRSTAYSRRSGWRLNRSSRLGVRRRLRRRGRPGPGSCRRATRGRRPGRCRGRRRDRRLRSPCRASSCRRTPRAWRTAAAPRRGSRS